MHISNAVLGVDEKAVKFSLFIAPGYVRLKASYRSRLGGGVRGRITKFSCGSRGRLMRKLGRYTVAPDYFVTLTSRGHGSDEEFRKRVKTLIDGTLRYMPRVTYVVWRLERGERGGKWHAHALWWSRELYCKGWSVLKHWRVRRYVESLSFVRTMGLTANDFYEGEVSGWADLLLYLTIRWCYYMKVNAKETLAVDVKRVGSFEELRAYVSKYVAKVNPDEEGVTGRVWGCRGNEKLAGPAEVVYVREFPRKVNSMLALLRELECQLGPEFKGFWTEDFPRGRTAYISLANLRKVEDALRKRGYEAQANAVHDFVKRIDRELRERRLEEKVVVSWRHKTRRSR